MVLNHLTLEQRVAALEREVAAMKEERRNPNWFAAVRGSFKDDPEFGEIIRLGAEIRNASGSTDVHEE